MKKTEIILLTIAVSIAAASCQREAAPDTLGDAVKQITITADIENDGAILIDGEEFFPETKTQRLSDGRVWWTPGDAISLFYGGDDIVGGNKFTAESTEPTAVTTFRGNISAATGGGEDVDPDDISFWAVYPYNKSTVCDGKSVTMSIPSTQVSGEDTFSQGQWPTIGKSFGLLFSFKNIAAGYKFKVATPGITKIVIRTPDASHPLAGTLNVSMDKDGIPVVNSVSNPSNAVVITPENGGTFKNDGTYYYATVLYQYLDAGVCFDFYKGDSVATYQCVLTGSKPERPSGRGKFKVMDNKDLGLAWAQQLPDGDTFNEYMKSLAGSLQNIKWIYFYCNQSNPEGSIKIADDVYMSYVEWGIELQTSKPQYFANEDCRLMFYGCKNVVSIDGLDNVNTSATTYMASMFDGCAKLKRVTLTGAFTTDNVKEFDYMFYDCNEIEALDLSHFNTRKAHTMVQVFYGCNHLKEVYLGKNFVIPDDCSHHEMLINCDATFYGTTEEMESFLRNLGDGADRNNGNMHFAIDMGEAGWWSAWNVGAIKPEGYGDYFAWGETKPKSDYSWSTYNVDNPSGDGKTFTKYNFNGGKTVLEKEDDAAAQNWGGKWRMPTWNDFSSLRECKVSWTENYKGTGIKGTILTSSNGNSIFLPAAGYRCEKNLLGRVIESDHWLSSIKTNVSGEYFQTYSGRIGSAIYSRCYGLSVRPISD